MPNTSVRAAAEGMPSINRRRMLLGLAAASAAAAAVITVEAANAQLENPDLIALSEELPAAVATYLAAKRAYKEWEKTVEAATPWAPDELTVPGTAWPYDDRSQPGEPEGKALGGYLWRVGDDFPRRIVINSWNMRQRVWRAKADLRKAKKAGIVADCLLAEDEVKRRKALLATAEAYEREFAKVKTRATAEHDARSAYKAHTELEEFIAKIMATPDWTMEGLVIKAQALAEWDRVSTQRMEKMAFNHGLDWHGQIAASILRHAKGCAA